MEVSYEKYTDMKLQTIEGRNIVMFQSIKDTLEELKANNMDSKAELKANITELKVELKADIQQVKNDVPWKVVFKATSFVSAALAVLFAGFQELQRSGIIDLLLKR